MFEHSVGTPARQISLVNKLFDIDNVIALGFVFCRFDIGSGDVLGEEQVQKIFRLFTNSLRIVSRMMGTQCAFVRRHEFFMDYRASACQRYPTNVCTELYKASKDELLHKNVFQTSV